MSRVLVGLTAVGLVITSASVALAQDERSDIVAEGRGYVSVGAGWLDLEQLNPRLLATGYQEFPERRLSIGAGGDAVRGQWVIGGEGHALVGRTKDARRPGADLEADVTAGYGFFNVGYLVWKQRSLLAYPFVGVGGGVVQLDVTERSFPTFDEILVDPRRSATIMSGGMLIQVGIGADKLFVLGSKTVDGYHHEGGVSVGLRVGYVFAPIQGDWRIRTTRIASGPDVGITGPFVRVNVGFGGRRLR